MSKLLYTISLILFSNLLMAEAGKIIYLSDVSSQNVSEEKRNEFRNIVQKIIVKKYKVNFAIENLEDVNHHLKVEKAKQLKGTCD